MLTDSSSLVTRLTEECHRSDGERSLEWQTPAVAYPFGSLHDLCVAVVVILLDEVVRNFDRTFHPVDYLSVDMDWAGSS